MLAFQMQLMALGSISNSFRLSCKCQSPLQRQQQPPPVLETVFTPAMLVDKEVPHTDKAVPFSILSLESAGGKAIIWKRLFFGDGNIPHVIKAGNNCSTALQRVGL